MLYCAICGHSGEEWGVKGATWEPETLSLYYEFQCLECDSLEINIRLSSESDESAGLL